MNKRTILLVEDDGSSRNFMRRILNNRDFIVKTANNGKEAISELKINEYDVVITDWLMPEVDGLELIEQIRNQFTKQPIIILLTAINSHEAKEMALEAGADEYLAKPVDIIKLVSILEKLFLRKKSAVKILPTIRNGKPSFKASKICVGITASTGGPPTLSRFFEELGAVDDAYFLIVQHGPEWMLESFTDSLQSKTKMKVSLGKDGVDLMPGHIYIAPGDKHMILKDNSTAIGIIDTPPVNYVKPSADPLFRSIAANFGKNSLGIVFTGMGQDGSYGSGYISIAGGQIIVQDPATCILPSMPSTVIKLKLANHIIPLNNMAAFVKNKIMEMYAALRNNK